MLREELPIVVASLTALSLAGGCASTPYSRGLLSRRLFEEDLFSEWEWLDESAPVARAEATDESNVPPRLEPSPPARTSPRWSRGPVARGLIDDSAIYRPLPTSLSLHFDP